MLFWRAWPHLHDSMSFDAFHPSYFANFLSFKLSFLKRECTLYSYHDGCRVLIYTQVFSNEYQTYQIERESSSSKSEAYMSNICNICNICNFFANFFQTFFKLFTNFLIHWSSFSLHWHSWSINSTIIFFVVLIEYIYAFFTSSVQRWPPLSKRIHLLQFLSHTFLISTILLI